MFGRCEEPTPWERTCPGFKRAIATAVATGALPGWVAIHLTRCPSCRHGLAHVLAQGKPLGPAGRGLARDVAFVARVHGLTREIAAAGQRMTRRPPRRRLRELLGDWRLPATAAVLLAVASAAFALYLILAGAPGRAGVDPEPMVGDQPTRTAIRDHGIWDRD